MILSLYKEDEFVIPHTSTCVIRTTGVLRDGDIVLVTSPIFASTNFTSKDINMSDSFKVPLKLSNNTLSIDNTKGDLKATLVCDDNDIFNMYIKI